MPKKKKTPLILGLISEKGGGKGTAAKYLEVKCHAKILRFSFFIEEMLGSVGAPTKDRDIIIRYMEKLRELFGYDVLALAVTRKIQHIKNQLIVLDGIRFPEELEFFHTHLRSFYTLAIYADPKNRYIRTKQRGEKINESRFTFSQFMDEHKRFTEKPIPGLMRRADVKIKNNGTIDELHVKLDHIMSGLQK